MKEYCTQIEITKDLRIDLFTDRGFRIRTFKNGRPDDPELYEIPFAVGHIDPWGPVAYEIRKEKKTVYIKTAVLTIIVNTETGIWTVETKEKQLYPSDKPVYGLICNGCMIFDSAAGIFERNKNSRYTHWFYNETSQQYDRYLGEDKIFDVYFLYGETYAALYREFNNLTGPVPMLPKPMFGFMQTQHLLKEGNQEKFLQLAKVMRAKQIPCDTLILDLEWGDGFDDDGNLVQWGSRMDWSGKYKRPFSPEEMIRQLKEMHYHLMMDFHSIPDIEHRDEVPIAVPANYIGVPHPVEEWKKI